MFKTFGYHACTFYHYIWMDYGRLVISAWGTTNLFKESDRHCWVIDGLKYYYLCDTGTSYMFLHCNWGYSGADNDYYGINGFNLDGSNLNHNVKFFKIVKRWKPKTQVLFY